MDARLLKEKAQQHFRQGRFARAAEAWAQVCKADPRDNGTRLRLGDALAKAGQPDGAFDAYRTAMDGFARQGFLPQAIAAAKLALALRPLDGEVQQLMASFHAERLGRPSSASLPSLDSLPLPGSFQSSPSGLLGMNVVRTRPSGMMPGPPPMLGAPSAPRLAPVLPPPPAPAPPPPPARAAIPVYDLGGYEPGGHDVTGEEPTFASPNRAASPVLALPEEEQEPAGPALDPLPIPDLTPPLERAPSHARAPRVRLEPGPDDPDATPPPPRGDADATLVPGRGQVPSPQALEVSLAGDPEATLHLASPFAGAGRAAERPGPPAPPPPAELAGPDLGRFPHIPLFEELSTQAFLALVEQSALRVLAAGQVVVEQGARGDSFFVVCGGRVRVFREDAAGRRELAILEPGAFFGELALLTGARRSAWVVAEVDDTRLLEVSAAVLDRVAGAHPSVAEGLLAFARRRMLSNVMSEEPLFSALKRSERQAWAERFTPRELAAGEILLEPGAPAPGLVVVVAGQLHGEAASGPGFEVGPGGLVGDVELLGGLVLARVAARAACSVLVLPPIDAGALLDHPVNAARLPTLLEAGRRRGAG